MATTNAYSLEKLLKDLKLVQSVGFPKEFRELLRLTVKKEGKDHVVTLEHFEKPFFFGLLGKPKWKPMMEVVVRNNLAELEWYIQNYGVSQGEKINVVSFSREYDLYVVRQRFDF
jgi:hypothetical protein